MTIEKKWGGVRSNSGRKARYGEKTVAVRIPVTWRDDLTRCLSENVNPFDCAQNQDAEKDKLISELTMKLEIVQNQVIAKDKKIAELVGELSATQQHLDCAQNQDAEKDRLISELTMKLEIVQNQDDNVQNQINEIKPIEPAPTPLSRKPARPVDSEIKKVVLQQANQLHVENSELTKSHIAKVLSEIFDIRFETVRDWLKKLW